MHRSKAKALFFSSRRFVSFNFGHCFSCLLLHSHHIAEPSSPSTIVTTNIYKLYIFLSIFPMPSAHVHLITTKIMILYCFNCREYNNGK